MQGDVPKTFLSYARVDAAFALRLAEDLRAAGVDLWIDQLDIPTGARWDQAVERALKECPRLLVILSPASTASQNVMDEVAFAIDEGRAIVPVLYQHCDIPFRLKRLQHIDFSGDYAKALATLQAALADPADRRRAFVATDHSSGKRIVTRRTAILLASAVALVAVGWGFRVPIMQALGLGAGGAEWMTAEQYQAAFIRQTRDGYFPYKLEGRCKDKIEQFRVEWKGFPLGSEGFFSHHGMTKDFYELKNQEYTAMGLSLDSLNSFKDCAGDDRYQANWFKRKPISWAK